MNNNINRKFIYYNIGRPLRFDLTKAGISVETLFNLDLRFKDNDNKMCIGDINLEDNPRDNSEDNSKDVEDNLKNDKDVGDNLKDDKDGEDPEDNLKNEIKEIDENPEDWIIIEGD